MRSLSDQFRPKKLDDFFGQERWVQKGGLVFESIMKKQPMNFLLWGPPGSGKTSLAQIYLSAFQERPQYTLHPSHFQVPKVKEIIDRAEAEPLFRPTLFWIDEIHRLTRPQQDLLLKAIEEGTICVVAATTENPSFVLSNALLSRLHILSFEPLHQGALKKIVQRALDAYPSLSLSDEVVLFLVGKAQGDARKLLSLLEPLVMLHEPNKKYEKIEEVSEICSSFSGSITAEGEGRYLLISALHKAVRGSDVDAAIYWLARMLHSGEDRLYLTRRLIRMALEDVGLADPEALQICLRAHEAYRLLGSPEGELALFEAVIFLALSPKSASAYVAMKQVMPHAEKTGHLMPPRHILNAPTRWMKQQGFSEGYIWDHDAEDAFSGQNYFPEEVPRTTYYEPVQRGFERELAKRYEYFDKLRKKRQEETD